MFATFVVKYLRFTNFCFSSKREHKIIQVDKINYMTVYFVLSDRYIKQRIPEKLSPTVYRLHKYVLEKGGWNITLWKYFELLGSVSGVELKIWKS